MKKDSTEQAKKLKLIAQKYNYDIKHTHCLEIISQMEGFNSRHGYLLNEKRNKSLFDSKNALFIGSIGSGKTLATRNYCYLMTLNNEKNTFNYVIDTIKGAADFSDLFDYESQSYIKITQDKDVPKLIHYFNALYEKMNTEFMSGNFDSSQIHNIVFLEFHHIYETIFKNNTALLEILLKLLKEGKKFGISFTFNEIKPNLEFYKVAKKLFDNIYCFNYDKATENGKDVIDFFYNGTEFRKNHFSNGAINPIHKLTCLLNNELYLYTILYNDNFYSPQNNSTLSLSDIKNGNNKFFSFWDGIQTGLGKGDSDV